MKLRTLSSLARSGNGLLMLRTTQLGASFFKVCFLAAASSSGLLAMLAQGAVAFERIAERLAPDPKAHEGLRAWLDFGVAAGVLRRRAGNYAVCGLGRALADPKNDAFAAILEELIWVAQPLVVKTPAMLREGRRFTMADQNGPIIARSSRVLEPFLFEAVDAVVPKSGAVRLLDVGCGSGIYMRYAAERNPGLTAAGFELQPEVAALARENLRKWGLGNRATVEAGDVRQKKPDAAFDAVMLNNNIYYFPIAERHSLLTHLHAFLKPGGRLLITTSCPGGGGFAEYLNLWGVLTEGGGPLPKPDEMRSQLLQAGFARATSKQMFPGVPSYAFVGYRAAQ